VDWFRERHADKVAVLADPADGDTDEYLAQFGAILERALEVSEYEDGVVLLDPGTRDANGEWGAFFYAPWTADISGPSHASFRALMEDELRTVTAFADEEGGPDLLAQEIVPAPSQSMSPTAAGEVHAEFEAAEARLGVTLPPSLRAILADPPRLDEAGQFVDRLRPAHRLQWFREEHPDWLAIRRIQTGKTNRLVTEMLERALVVSEPAEAAYVLDPKAVDARGEWQAWRVVGWENSVRKAPDMGALLRREQRNAERMRDPFAAPAALLVDAALQARSRSCRGDLARPLAELEHIGLAHRLATTYLIQIYGLLGRWEAIREISPGIAGYDDADPLDANTLYDEILPQLFRAARELDDEDMLKRLRQQGSPVMRRALASRAKFEGWWRATVSRAPNPIFPQAIERARGLVARGRDDEAWVEIIGSLHAWEACFPSMLAPAGLACDHQLGHLITPDRGRQILETRRGGGWQPHPASLPGWPAPPDDPWGRPPAT
jgi:hypothetical protein